ncbi:alpha/beta fold hydrolase [Mycolicibacterium moriokaense]|uniref:Pimeloyl-ACP methyl ester carboxylesterase n=1 Tax=Mycolicibacterium moriokaense TaxID=39691 RepID=A0A318H3T8_9MYCO|nr:alpha/beta hydrolase [Mycolicibacterium moriokaense]PXW98236.1 pimeloyl-ACP methyl ester carboxylesterase [Mycolicibacterium moriokaense]
MTTGSTAHTERTVTVRDGVRLAVRDQGPVDAEATVVLLHGLCLEQGSWAGQIRQLTRRWGARIRIISFDHRGHGRSDTAPTHTYVIEQLAADLADVLSALDVTGPLTLVGHSMGGMVALAYLGRPPADRPVQPHGVVLVATAAGRLAERGVARLLASPATDVLCKFATRAPHRAVRLLTKPVRAALAFPVGDQARAILATLFETAMTAASLTTAVGFLPSLRSYDQYSTLAAIRARTTIISGGADLLTPPSHSHDLADAIPGATHVHIPTAGHMLPHEASHEVTDAISRTVATGIGPDPEPTAPVYPLGQRYSVLAKAA